MPSRRHNAFLILAIIVVIALVAETALAEQMLENRLLKKSMIGDGGDEE